MTEKIIEFAQNVFCRRDSNQHKAYKLWEDISTIMSDDDKLQFRIEWNHYLLDGDVDQFAYYFNKYVKKYIKIVV